MDRKEDTVRSTSLLRHACNLGHGGACDVLETDNREPLGPEPFDPDGRSLVLLWKSCLFGRLGGCQFLVLEQLGVLGRSCDQGHIDACWSLFHLYDSGLEGQLDKWFQTKRGPLAWPQEKRAARMHEKACERAQKGAGCNPAPDTQRKKPTPIHCPSGATLGSVLGEEWCIKDGFLDGPSASSYPWGDAYSLGGYKANLRSGDWTFHWPHGEVLATGRFTRGKLDGTWTYYHWGGDLAATIAYREGVGDGPQNFYLPYSGGAVEAGGDFKDGRPHGEWYYSYESDKPMARGSFVDGKRTGHWQKWHKNGRVWKKARFQEGRRHGMYACYSSDGTLLTKGRRLGTQT